MFTDAFDPFWEPADYVANTCVEDEKSESDSSEDSDFVVEPHNQVDEVDVDMNNFRLNIDFDVEWVGKNDLMFVSSKVSGDANTVNLEDFESNSD